VIVLRYMFRLRKGRNVRVAHGSRVETCERDADENSLRIGPAVICGEARS
jgi:hypothetical protein